MLDDATQPNTKKTPRLEYLGVTVEADPAGRRIWPPDLSRRLAQESFNSSLSVEAFAREWELCPSVLSRWRMQLVAESKPKAPKKGKKPSEPAELPAFAPLVCSEPQPAAPVCAASIELECAGVILHGADDHFRPRKARQVLPPPSASRSSSTTAARSASSRPSSSSTRSSRKRPGARQARSPRASCVSTS